MKFFIYIYLFLYISYVILGPHYITRLLKNDKLEIVKSPEDLISRIFFLSYIADLFNAYFFYNPNILSWILALIINLSALLGYIIKWYPIRNTDPYYYTGVFAHILIILPVVGGYFYYNLLKDKINLKKLTQPIILTSLFLIIYFFIQNNIYI